MEIKTLIRHRQEIKTKQEEKAYRFIEGLILNNIPLEFIFTNDFKNCPEPKVYLFKKEFKRFSKTDLKRVVNFWKNNKSKTSYERLKEEFFILDDYFNELSPESKEEIQKRIINI